MTHWINKDQIKEAFISEPYENSGEVFEVYPSHGWQVILIMNYNSDGYHDKVTIDRGSENDCINLLMKLGLILIQ